MSVAKPKWKLGDKVWLDLDIDQSPVEGPYLVTVARITTTFSVGKHRHLYRFDEVSTVPAEEDEFDECFIFGTREEVDAHRRAISPIQVPQYGFRIGTNPRTEGFNSGHDSPISEKSLLWVKEQLEMIQDRDLFELARLAVCDLQDARAQITELEESSERLRRELEKLKGEKADHGETTVEDR